MMTDLFRKRLRKQSRKNPYINRFFILPFSFYWLFFLSDGLSAADDQDVADAASPSHVSSVALVFWAGPASLAL
jgi:hypothetical protein